ncbi:hypothetical protein N7520_008753 [Penicillium odoratum]|uniref:uncharacterized protein n=1 Tax=Penicillium odoratum TaxID=1167516 RepID=UPI0025490A22|nr:uncharacterized protein N7520_008753 [Penicillium odoratum]KAJ5751836.1 hypothetical protein N7520_008753 [Penicillium odoratum]
MESQTLSAAPPTQRLKDSCDKCSTSKVRCTKEKPSCARCDKLGYTCFYSPARRVGRPHRSKESSSKGNNSEESENLPARIIQPTTFTDEGDKLLSELDLSSTRLDQHDVFPVQQENIISNQQHISDQDCMLVMMELFSELEVPATQLRYSSSVDSNLLEMTTQTITATLRRLSAILICPCSERAETAMLISAVCMTILDIHAMMIVKFHETLEPEAAAMRVLGELSNVAQSVFQFSERYNGDFGDGVGVPAGNDVPVDFLPSLGNLMRERLQQITNDVTCW